MVTVSLDGFAQPPNEFVSGALTIGNFDGVHRGHRALISALRSQADRLPGPAVVLTFDPPPHQVLYPGSARPPLTTVPLRIELLREAGADGVVFLRTSPGLLALSPEAFFEEVLVRQFRANAIVEGHDFRFGRGRSGTNATLRALCTANGLTFEEIPEVFHRGEVVSSSRVRAAIVRGDVELAAELLERPYRLQGTVVAGAKRGRTIGFPTANLEHIMTVLPGNGVYAARARVEGTTYAAAANIGPNPTFGEDVQKVEVHLIAFDGDLYGQSIAVDFTARLRDTRPFASVDELIEQLAKDVAAAQRMVEQTG